jgi:hypothetical protein
MSVFSAVGKGIHAFRMKVSGNGDAHALNGTRRDRYDDLDDEYDDDLDFDGTAAPVIEPERAPAYRM